MTSFNGFVLFVLIWWTALFVVLPLGTRPIAAPDAASGWRGAPAAPHIARKLLLTTLCAAVIWLVCFAVIASDVFNFRHGWLALPQD